MTWYTHVNRNTIASNAKHGTAKPAVRLQEGLNGKPEYCFEVEFPAGARMVYNPQEPILRCGAKLAILSKEKPRIIR